MAQTVINQGGGPTEITLLEGGSVANASKLFVDSWCATMRELIRNQDGRVK
jgi:hypothetical protein